MTISQLKLSVLLVVALSIVTNQRPDPNGDTDFLKYG